MLNQRQSAFIMMIGECFKMTLDEVGYKCDTFEERAEVLEALEVFYTGLHKASIEIKEEEDNGRPDTSKEL